MAKQCEAHWEGVCEKRRDALHQLADTASTLGRRILAVTADRELGGEIVLSIRAIHSVLRSIETLMEKHRANKPFHKALSYMFTTSKRIEGLNQDLSRATQEFLLVAAIDTNARVQENAKYIGKFRYIRDCDVKHPVLIMEQQPGLSKYRSQIYSAEVDGYVYIVRCFARNPQVEYDGKSSLDEWRREEVIEHDRFLEQLSTVPNLHRNIARLYGRSSGEHFDRFNVMSLGCIPISEVSQFTATVDGTWNIIRQLLDALCHLNARGATWDPDLSHPIFVDATGAPIIGLHNDLRKSGEWIYWWQIHVLSELLERGLEAPLHGSQTDADNLHTLAFRTIRTAVAIQLHTTRRSIPRRLIPNLNEKISRYLQNALASYGLDQLAVWMHPGAVVLRAAASGRTVGSQFYTVYWAEASKRDSIDMHCVEERDHKLTQLETKVYIPDPIKDEFRKRLGIALQDYADKEWFFSTRNPTEPSSMSFSPLYLER